MVQSLLVETRGGLQRRLPLFIIIQGGSLDRDFLLHRTYTYTPTAVIVARIARARIAAPRLAIVCAVRRV
jgi:hypothetical protein